MQTRQDVLSILGREKEFFQEDLESAENELSKRIADSSFLVLGGAGSIGQAVVKALFSRNPGRLDVVDISENNLVELVRDIRSSSGYMAGEFRTLPLDIGQPEFGAFTRSADRYDYILNLSALKHVRSEKDPFTLMRMVAVNILNTHSTLRYAIESGAKRYFAVSSDKAANPANAMGATKRVVELCLVQASTEIKVVSARFANVAFSDGSLLHGFTRRLAKRQPLSAPEDVRRFFITDAEAAVLCLMGCLLGENREVFFPNIQTGFEAIDFRTIAERFLAAHGYRAYPCESEDEARARVDELASQGQWPCYFFASDTTGEKPVEEFWMPDETLDLERFREIGVVRWPAAEERSDLDDFLKRITSLRGSGHWTRELLLQELQSLLPEFRHLETGRFLDSKM